MNDIQSLHEELMQNPEYAQEYEATREEFSLQRALIKMRLDCNLTQEELAERTGIRQSNISRIETGESNPNLSTLKALAHGCGRKVKIEFIEA